MRRFLAFALTLSLGFGPSHATHTHRYLQNPPYKGHNAAYKAWKRAEYSAWRSAVYHRWLAQQRLIGAWSRVAVCESGGWVVLGPKFPDSLGITAHNWWAYGGTSDKSPMAQIRVAQRIQFNPPDQNGCQPGGW